MHQPIAAVIFDVEGVIAHPDREAADAMLAAVSDGLNMATLDIVRNTPGLYELWERYSTGHLESTGYWSAVLTAAGADSSDEAVAALRSILIATWWARLDDNVLDVAAALRGAGRRVALLSNSAPEHDDVIRVLGPRFDAAHFSHQTGRRKPSPDAYLAVARVLGVPTSGCLFVDDKERNTVAAAKLGMQAVLFRGAGPLTDELWRWLGAAPTLPGGPGDPT